MCLQNEEKILVINCTATNLAKDANVTNSPDHFSPTPYAVALKATSCCLSKTVLQDGQMVSAGTKYLVGSLISSKWSGICSGICLLLRKYFIRKRSFSDKQGSSISLKQDNIKSHQNGAKPIISMKFKYRVATSYYIKFGIKRFLDMF